MSAQFTQAIADLRLVLPAEKIAKLELLDDYDLIAPLLTKHKAQIKKVKSAPPEVPLEERQAKAWAEILAKPPADDYSSSQEHLRLLFKRAKVRDTAIFGTDKGGNPYIKVSNPALIEMFYKLVSGLRAESDKKVATKKVSGNRRGRKTGEGHYQIKHTNTRDNAEGKDNPFYFKGDEDIVFERDGKIADDINGGLPIKKKTWKAVRRAEDFITGKGANVCPGAVQWERAMGSKTIKRLGKTHATFRLQCGQDRGDADEYCVRCQRKGSKVENFWEGKYADGQSYVDFIVENTNTEYCPPAKPPPAECQKCGKTEKDFDGDFDGPAIVEYAVNGQFWCPDCISDDCNKSDSDSESESESESDSDSDDN